MKAILLLLPHSLRLLHIAAKYRLDNNLRNLRLPLLVRCMIFSGVWRLLFAPIGQLLQRNNSQAKNLRLALETSGPVFVKFGQLLSTRPDLFSDATIKELSILQDAATPVRYEQMFEIIKQQLPDADTIFTEIDKDPLGSASVAQVHAAKLMNGDAVIIKVIRPGIRKKISKDINLLSAIAKLIQTFFDVENKLRLQEIVADYTKILNNETNMLVEASNCAQIQRNFANSKMLYTPNVYWAYTTPSVLTQERIFGVKPTDLDELEARGVNREVLAKRGVEIFLHQVFDHAFFHADVHPGNIMIICEDPENPVYASVDFGIVGMLDDKDRFYLAHIFLAFFKHDFRKIAQIHLDLGWVEPVSQAELAHAFQANCEMFFHLPSSELSFANVLQNLLNTARQYKMTLQPQLVLLKKTIFYVEGLGRTLYPQLDLWQTMMPFLQRWTRQQLYPTQMLQRAQYRLPTVLNAIQNSLENNMKPDSNFELRLQNIERSNNGLQIILAVLTTAAVVIAWYTV